MKALIIEDEPQAISALKHEIKLNCSEIISIETAQSVKNGINKIKNFKPDLIFLDIQLSDGLGFDILKKITKINFKIIFTTAYSEYAIQAIKFSALDYLLKPINSNELKLAVKKASIQNQKDIDYKVAAFLHNQNALNKKIAIQTTNGVFIHEISTIIKCLSNGNYTQIYLTNGKKILISKTLKDFEELLTPFNFERIHHSHLINLNHLISFNNKDGGYVIMSDNSTLAVSQRKKSSFLKRLENFIL